MIAEIGLVSISVALVSAVISTLLAVAGAFSKNETIVRSARNLLTFVFGLLTLACLVLVYAQWTGDYSLTYVSNVSSNTQPDSLKITALWGGQEGSMLFYSWMLSLFSVAAVWFNWRRHRRLMPWVIFFTAATLAFFLVLNVFLENAFERHWIDPDEDQSSRETSILQPEGKEPAYPWKGTVVLRHRFDLSQAPVQVTAGQFSTSNSVEDPPIVLLPDGTTLDMFPDWTVDVDEREPDGTGLNPLLRHPGMVIHPPLLYLGFTGFVIPFAFAMGALIIGQMDANWIGAVRRWSLIAWMFLSIGLVLGGRWAYDVLGWGGYWGWDPVENAAFLPWLTGTAFLHSVMIQEKRGMLKGWNMVMIMGTYLLVLLGTISTRTGLVSSVHAFAKSDLAVPMGGFFAAMLLGSVALYLWRGNKGYFQGDHEIEGILSRESMFMLNNWVFFALTIVVFWGTWAEKITDFLRELGLRDSTINLGPDYYETPTAFLFLLIFILMGVAPLVAWRRASAERLGRALQWPMIATILTFMVLMVYGDILDVGAYVDAVGGDQMAVLKVVTSWHGWLESLGNRILPVVGASIIVFAGVATAIEIYKGVMARHKAHNEPHAVAFFKLLRRNRRRYGGYIIHLAVVIMGIGILASTVFQQTSQQELNPGDTMELGPYTMRYDRLTWNRADDDREMIVADVSIVPQGKDPYNEDNVIDRLRPRRDLFETGSPMSISGTRSTIGGDFYILLVNPEISQVTEGGRQALVGNTVTFRIHYNPLVNFVWWGSYLLVIGTLVAAWPERDPVTVVQRRRAPLSVPLGAGD